MLGRGPLIQEHRASPTDITSVAREISQQLVAMGARGVQLTPQLHSVSSASSAAQRGRMGRAEQVRRGDVV